MWLDVSLESISFLLVSLLCLKIFQLRSTDEFREQSGITMVCLGTLLISLALLLDVSDDFTSLNFLQVVGDTPIEAVLEKTGYFFGYLLLAIGFSKWLPVVRAERRLRNELQQSNTQLQQANHSINVQQQLYQAITTSLDTAILLLDRQGRTSFCNPAATTILGYDAQELAGLEVLSLCAPVDPTASPEQLTRMFSQTQSRKTWQSCEALVTTKSGETIPVEIATRQAELSEEWHRLCTICDIRERKRHQQEREDLLKQLRHAHKMEAIGLLAGGIAHDFNNLLAAIIGYSEVALSKPDDLELVEHSIGEVLTAGNRAAELIKRISTFSHKNEVSMEPTRLGEVLDETLGLLRETLPSNIDFDLHRSEEKTILGNASQIQQVLMNLCINALHAMPDGGTLSITSSCEAIAENQLPAGRELQPGSYMRLEIRDTGHGIPQQILDRIFDPYFTTKDPGKGTGLGLAIVQGIIHDHGGWISVDSRLHQGTSFGIYLPICTTDIRTDSASPHLPDRSSLPENRHDKRPAVPAPISRGERRQQRLDETCLFPESVSLCPEASASH